MMTKPYHCPYADFSKVMPLPQTLTDWFRDPDVAIDLGTANTRLFALGQGLLADVPTMTGANDLGAHTAANQQVPKAPLAGGVVTDVSGAGEVLKGVVDRARKFGRRRPRAIACAPTDVSNAELTALITAVHRAGVSSVKVIPEPLAAAVGAGLDISLPYAQAIIDLGAGVTDIAVVRSGVIIHKAAVRIGYSDFYPAVQRMIAQWYGLMVPPREAERLTREVASVDVKRIALAAVEAHGIDDRNGHTLCVEVDCEDVSSAIQPVIAAMMQAVRKALSSLPAEESAEVIESGISITGGGACLPGINRRIAEETSLEVTVAAEPLHAVIKGASEMLAVGRQTGIWNEPAASPYHWAM